MNELKATLQTKNGMYYCVISYKENGKWKLNIDSQIKYSNYSQIKSSRKLA